MNKLNSGVGNDASGNGRMVTLTAELGNVIEAQPSASYLPSNVGNMGEPGHGAVMQPLTEPGPAHTHDTVLGSHTESKLDAFFRSDYKGDDYHEWHERPKTPHNVEQLHIRA
jgi:hypothetical protein